MIPLILAILIMGLSGIVAQILLLRELLIIFSGNELSIGIILANWLLLEAAGSFWLGKRIEKIARKIEAFVLVQLVFSLALPLAVFLTRSLSGFMKTVPGEGLGFIPVLYFSFLILLPVSLPHGALFTFGCKVYSEVQKKQEAEAGIIGKVYVYETIGSIIGGLVFVYLMIPYLQSLQIAFIVALLNLIVCAALLRFSLKNWFQATLTSLSILLFLFGGYLLFGGGVDKIHWLSIKNQWKGQKVVYYKNSIYGNVSVVEREKQYTFFTDGIPSITTPTPDIVFVEEFVHLPMLSHQSPEEILVLSGGAGGVIGEILKYRSVKKIDYAELDPLLLKAVKKFPTPLTQSELENQKVDIQNIDGRLFIQRTQKLYDLIFVGVSNPTDLQVNRMFTKEFFVLAKKKLKPGGIFVIGLPGSLTSLSKELKNLNGCILNTLRSIYPSIRIIPGDFNLFLASNSEEITLINETLLSKRLEERELRTNLLTKGHLKYKLDKRRLEWFLSSLNQERKINSDFIPLAVFHSLAYRNALFSPYIQKWFQWFEKINLKQIIFFLAIFTLGFIFICSRIKGSLKIAVPLAILFTGFAGMLFDLILVFTFQVLCGYVFYQIGLLVTALMVGTTVGSGLMTFFLERMKKSIPFFMKVELSIILFSGILPVIFLILHPHLENRSVFFLTQVSFLVLSFISGFLIGVQFPLAAMIHSRFSPKLGTTAGLLYGADLFGGYIGGVIGGIVLLPILGLVKTCFVVAMVKISSLIIFIFSSKRFT